MTTMTATPGFVTAGVDRHLDVHVAATLDHLGGVLGTATFPTAAAGYAQLLDWLQRKVTDRHGSADRMTTVLRHRDERSESAAVLPEVAARREGGTDALAPVIHE